MAYPRVRLGFPAVIMMGLSCSSRAVVLGGGSLSSTRAGLE